MDDLVKSGGSGLVGLLHGKGGEISIPKKTYFFLILM